MFSDKDLDQIEKKGQTKEKVLDQIKRYKDGFPELNIYKAANVGRGIKVFNEKKMEKYVELYDNSSKRLKKIKFVPASGAASRMFKDLFEVLNNYDGTECEYLKLMENRGFGSVYYMCQNLRNFAFFDDLKQILRDKKSNYDELSKKKDIKELLRLLLTSDGLNYANLPKGLLKFHRGSKGSKTPVEEHLIEGAKYAASGKKVNIHFTVSEEHIQLFKSHLANVSDAYEKKFKVKFNVSFSIQKTSTDTIAVDAENNPFRDSDGKVVFRPGGHGALIENLNDIEADIVFVKNIDNVIQDRLKKDTILYKKVLAGYLIKIRKETFDWIKKLSKKRPDKHLDDVVNFVTKVLCIKLPDEFVNFDDGRKVDYLLKKLNRPIRVCGMVRNEGEPGGGPFWVQEEDGSVALQIVESSQIPDEMSELMKKATHFNPVDLICSVTDYKGNKFDLTKYVDEDTGFISRKSFEGRELKALELPGLWNGAMANWNTVFVEVPITTFSPVKTLNDLLKTEHLYEKDLLGGQADDNSVLS